MPFVEAKCTNCGAVLPVDSARDAWVCGYCGTPFIVEKAINLYSTTNNITADTVNVYGTKDFDIRGGVLLKYNGEAMDVIVPDAVVEIAGTYPHINGAFSHCAGIRSIVIPGSVEVIGDNAFMNCARLQKVELKLGVKVIKCNAFNGCSALKEIILPDSLRIVEKHAFTRCSSLERITIPNNIEKIGSVEKTTIRDGEDSSIKLFLHTPFDGCNQLRDVVISEGCFERVCQHRQIDGVYTEHTSGGLKVTHCFAATVFAGTPYDSIRKQKEIEARKERQLLAAQEHWKSKGRCQHCGGKISEKKGFSCKSCGKAKDY